MLGQILTEKIYLLICVLVFAMDQDQADTHEIKNSWKELKVAVQGLQEATQLGHGSVWMKVQAIVSQCTEQDQDLVSGPESQLHIINQRQDKPCFPQHSFICLPEAVAPQAAS